MWKAVKKMLLVFQGSLINELEIIDKGLFNLMEMVKMQNPWISIQYLYIQIEDNNADSMTHLIYIFQVDWKYCIVHSNHR